MINKVVISGVDTSKLPILSNEEKNELLKRIKNGDKKARDKFVEGNLRLVLSLVQRFAGRGESMDDLFQVGCVGLIKSIDNFDLGLGLRFSTYGVPMILGEIRRYLRDNNMVRVSRATRDLAYKALSAKEKLSNEKIQIYDLSHNLMFTGANLIGIDTCGYERNNSKRIWLKFYFLQHMDSATGIGRCSR